MPGFSWPVATMSKACTSGMPACSMVASCRLKIAMSSVRILLRFWNSALSRRIWVGTRPWRRRVARTAASLTATTEPFSKVPFWSLPCHLNGYCFAACAMACYSSCWLFMGGASPGYSIVTRLSSSRLVTPFLTLNSPARRRSQMPSLSASAAICIALPPSMMMRPIVSVTGMTWIDADAALVAVVALAAADGAVDREALVDLGLREAFLAAAPRAGTSHAAPCSCRRAGGKPLGDDQADGTERSRRV
jgi:hypothetical protein